MILNHLKKKLIKKNIKTNSFIHPTILVFDSGVGGLSIYREIKKISPDSHYIYVFDNEAFPYGEKTEEFIINRVFEIIKAIASKHLITIAVIACNTASTVSLTKLRKHFSFPIVGTVPAIKPAIKTTRNGIIGLLATTATIKSKYTKELINQFAINCKIVQLNSSTLVQLAEKKIYGKKPSLNKINQIIKQWITMPEPPDTIILGCTHFHLLKNELKKVFPHKTKFIDSSSAIAKRTIWLINNQIEIKFSNEKNFAYCLSINKNLRKLRFVLKKEGFISLKQLFI
ncbi:Glutamate racemase [Candidatus Providencia siddallii]|uniref:Glutamate racemase n=1 Tax=Candidatus Providencia siddallii TaxID=1715285 RepID=A0A0M6WA32_9GAMM|nr:Glutamate racemase [Candidatus Providencia siddallii]